MPFYVGTSGYAFKEWKGTFYPAKFPDKDLLGYYAGRFPTVEINNTFYRMPRSEMLAKWAEEVPPEFQFVLKAPQRITHQLRLAPESADAVKNLADTARVLGARLGPVLFQLPPFSKQDLPKLQAFLGILREQAPGLRAAFEFRHVSWFEPEVFQALREAGAALCVAEDEKLVTPLEATADWGYLRLRRQDYGDAAVADWAARIQTQPWREAYVFFKHEDEGVGPKLAGKMLELLGGGASVQDPGRSEM
jgi:uncharacterized protein YecE (DUF72 family)